MGPWQWKHRDLSTGPPENFILNMVIWDQSYWITSFECMLSNVWLFVAPWTVACQTPLSMEFSRLEYWSRLPFPSFFPTQGSNCISCIGRWISYHHAMWEALTSLRETFNNVCWTKLIPTHCSCIIFVHLPLNSQCYNNPITLVSIFLTTVSILFKGRYSGFSKPEGIRISMVWESQN